MNENTLKDRQGNLPATIHGNTVERLSYDAWGRRRNPNTLKDHQGNLPATIHGNTMERMSYDAWGRHHNPVLADLQSASIEYQHL
jgi:YD repeat-containing protein